MLNWWEDDAGTTERKETWELVASTFLGKTQGSSWVRASCPFCLSQTGKEDKKDSLGINPKTGGYNCFKCGTKGRLPPKFRAQLDLEDGFGAPVEERQIVEHARGFLPLYAGSSAQAPHLDFARAYLEGSRETRVGARQARCRGLPAQTCAEMGVGAAVTGNLFGRVIVPLPDYYAPEHPWRGWVSRDATGESPMTYRYPKGMSREGLLFNLPALFVETEAPVFVCEGVFDAAPLWPDAVACLGKPLASHVSLLQLASRPIVIALDGDAWEEGWMLSQKLKFLSKQRVGFIKFPPKTDPNEVPTSWIREEARKCLL